MSRYALWAAIYVNSDVIDREQSSFNVEVSVYNEKVSAYIDKISACNEKISSQNEFHPNKAVKAFHTYMYARTSPKKSFTDVLARQSKI